MAQKICIVSPSGAIDPSLIDGAASRLQQWGFDVTIAPHAKGAFGRFAATEEERLADLNAALADPSLDYILCGRGGYGLAQIIDKVQIPSGKVPTIIGFSDITALHCLCGHYNVRSIHAVMAKHLSEYETHQESAEALHHLLLHEPLSYTCPSHPLNRPGKAKGILRGGNLSVLYGLQATPYCANIQEGDILFLEDVGEHPYAIDRMMQNLRLSGGLSRLGGLIVGQFSDYEEDARMPYTVYEGIRKMVEPYDYPVMMDFPAGHVERNLPLLINAECQLSVGSSSVCLEQSF